MAYTATVTVDQKHYGSLTISRDAIITGQIDITNYNSTHVAQTDITKHFRSTKRVVVGSASDNGYLGKWQSSVGAIKVYSATAAAIAQASDGVDAGVFDFIAYGTV